jgi:hypothetical protein
MEEAAVVGPIPPNMLAGADFSLAPEARAIDAKLNGERRDE